MKCESQSNKAVFHCDDSLLASKKAAWASWNYHIPKKETGRVAVTYDMNILQSIGDVQMLFAKPLYRRNELRPAL
jgi:predicted NAD/FAD-binding protein